MELTERFDRAMLLASTLHRRQRRKGTDVPYLSHLLAVSALVMEHGGTEDEAIAALLHDAVEDQGGVRTLERIQNGFGEPVAALVLALSDTTESPKPPWKDRKEEYLEHLEGAPDPVLLISAADKLHNARTILEAYREIGDDLWGRFSAPVAEQLWYYRSLSDLFRRRLRGPLSSELDQTVDTLEALMHARPHS